MIERDLIRQIADKARRPHPNLIAGIGDDCAVFSTPAGKEWLISTDMLVEGVHFDISWHQPYLLGRKALAVNMSDVAAMGGTPQFALLSVGVPGSFDSTWVERFLDGVLAILDEYTCVLIGGDTVSAKQLAISVSVLGTAASGCSITRSGAGPGDSVFVSGVLGSSAAGLHLLQRQQAAPQLGLEKRWQQLTAAHLDPQPRVALAGLLAASGMVTAMQDVSDGIATDLSHICTASKVSAVLEQCSLPAHRELTEMCAHFNLKQTELQLKGGEDYELLFTVRKGQEDNFARYCRKMYREQGPCQGGGLPPVTRIGVVEAGSGVLLRTAAGDLMDIEYQGYEHSS